MESKETQCSLAKTEYRALTATTSKPIMVDLTIKISDCWKGKKTKNKKEVI